MLRLASSSPRRIQLLRLLQIPFESTVPDVNEQRFTSPARAKADTVARSGEVTLAADTEILVDGDRVGKPADESHAVAMLATLSGREHEVSTEVAVVAASGARRHFAVRSRVRCVARMSVGVMGGERLRGALFGFRCGRLGVGLCVC